METTEGLVDWELATRIAGRLAAPGPVADRAELTALVDELRDAAGRAAVHASAITGLSAVDGRPPEQVSTVLVVDRPRWAQANAEVFAAMTGPLVGAAPSSTARAGAAVQVGGVLALLSGKVLGQFDPFTSTDGRGRLLLVAPNVLHHERRLKVNPSDFRLWVALHEQTHALQFAAARVRRWSASHGAAANCRAWVCSCSATQRRKSDGFTFSRRSWCRTLGATRSSRPRPSVDVNGSN